jgi:branched-chain amino acid transport system permease protein
MFSGNPPLRVSRKRLGYLFLGAVFVLAPLIITPTQQRLVTIILVWGIFAVGFDLLFGYTGMVSFGHGAFFGGGMYAAAFVYNYSTISNILIVLGVAVVSVTLLGALVAFISTQAKGVQFAILTFIFAEIIYTIFNNWTEVTGGSNGLSFTIPSISFFPRILELDPYQETPKYYVILVFTILVVIFMAKLVNSPLGAIFKGVRENPERMNYLGFNARRFRILSFSISAGIAGLAGALFAIVNSFVGPSILGLQTHGDVIIHTIIGGPGTVIGPLLGTGLIVYVQDWLSATISWWLIPIGLLFIFVVIFMPDGIAGKLKST